MLLNILLGFIIPWTIAIAYFPNREILVFMAPISSVIAFAINTIGFYLYWDVRPIFNREQSLSRLPIDLGLYPILGSYLVCLIISTPLHPFSLIFFFTIITTIAELIAVKIGKVIYYNGWRGYWTFFSYLISYGLVYSYYLLLKSFHVSWS